MNFLSEIISRKQQLVDSAKQAMPIWQLRELAEHARVGARSHWLRDALSVPDRINIIAEFKRRSPSKGVIRNGANASDIARQYVSGGAVAISVLTEENYFDGSLNDLRAVRNEVEVPVLRKDFVFDEYQVYEAAAAGADAVLLIVAALNDMQLSELRETIEGQLGMDALVEVHDEHELQRAESSGATLIGVNNRDLRTFQVSLDTSRRIIRKAPARALLVSESGLNTASDLQELHRAGYRGFLIGESLMRAESPKLALLTLLGNSQ
jgi:indole-3-glycerol phosphate synthase